MFRNQRAGLAVIALAILWVAASTNAQSGNGYDLTWSTIDGGGETFSLGNGYELGGTIGQADAGTLSNDGYDITGGFWAISCSCRLHGDVAEPYCMVDLDDILYILNAFADPDPCVNFPNSNIVPCGCQSDPGFLPQCNPCVVDLDDILSVLGAFQDNYDCSHPCPMTELARR
jgi:hypothetical protein